MDTRKRWITSGRRQGKSAVLKEMETDFILDYPDAVIVRPRPDGTTIVEKPVKAVIVEPRQIEHDSE